MTSAKRRKRVSFRLQSDTSAHAKRTQSSILLTEKGWTAHKADNDSTHEWAYIRTVESTIDMSVKSFQCMHCKLEKRANVEDATYISKQGVSNTCPPCPHTIAVPQLTTGDTK